MQSLLKSTFQLVLRIFKIPDRTVSLPHVVIAVVDVSTHLRHFQNWRWIRRNGWPGQGVEVSDVEFILPDTGNVRTGIVVA